MNIPMKYIALIAVLLLALAVLAFRKSKPKTSRLPLPTDNVFNPLPQVDKEKVREIAAGLYNDMKGFNFNFFSRDTAPYRSLAIASDSVFVAVCEYFNKHLGDGDSLREWMKWEAFNDLGEIYNYVKTIYARMDKHGIK